MVNPTELKIGDHVRRKNHHGDWIVVHVYDDGHVAIEAAHETWVRHAIVAPDTLTEVTP